MNPPATQNYDGPATPADDPRRWIDAVAGHLRTRRPGLTTSESENFDSHHWGVCLQVTGLVAGPLDVLVEHATGQVLFDLGESGYPDKAPALPPELFANWILGHLSALEI